MVNHPVYIRCPVSKAIPNVEKKPVLDFGIYFGIISAYRNKSCLLFLSAEMFKKPIWQTVLTQIRLLLGAVCSGSTLFASILDSLAMLGNYLQQTTSAEVIFSCIFFLAL